MSIKEKLKQIGQPTLNPESVLYYHVGNAAITFSLLILLSWVSVAFGQQFHFSFSWILVIGLLVAYYPICTKLSSATAIVLVVLTLLALLVGYPSPSTFSILLFLVCLVGGYFVQMLAHKKSDGALSIKAQLIALLYAPMAYTYYLLEATKLNQWLSGKGGKNAE